MSNPAFSPAKREFAKKMQEALEAKKAAEFPGLMKRFFGDLPISTRDKEVFDFAYTIAFAHVIEYLGEHAQIVLKPAPSKVN